MNIKTVTIPATPKHEGQLKAVIKLEWVCPTCGQERGEINNVRSYDGSLSMVVDGWENPCGHIDKYTALIKEATANQLNK